MEIWDLYDEDRRLTGETMIRGDKVPEGRYHLVVDALFLNSRGETLLQRRADTKDILPGIWSVTGGSALRGETAAEACARETEEEMGFRPDMQKAEVLYSERRNTYFRDVYLIYQDVPLSTMHYQEEEVQDARWILPEAIIRDAGLWGQMTNLRFWEDVYPYLCLRSMRIRIPEGTYRHFKGNRYRVKGLALHSETLEPMVIYQALYGQGETWVRPAGMWLEKVGRDGRKTPRFQLEET